MENIGARRGGGKRTGISIDHSATITQLTSTTVRGTFQGTVKAAGRPDVAITNGECYVQRIN